MEESICAMLTEVCECVGRARSSGMALVTTHHICMVCFYFLPYSFRKVYSVVVKSYINLSYSKGLLFL